MTTSTTTLPNTEQVPDSIKIWRYMDFAKLISLLEDSILYLPRSDRFEDKYEGTFPHTNIEVMEDFLATGNVDISGDWFEHIEWLRGWTYVSCWHMNPSESYAMWKLYARTNEAIAIQSTLSLLRSEMPDHALIGLVQYKDYDTYIIESLNRFAPFLHKRASFEHEKEMRVLIQDPPPDGQLNTDRASGPVGLTIPVNLDNLIETIYIAPHADAWLFDLVTKIVLRYGLNCKVKRSALERPPATYTRRAQPPK